MDQPQLESVSVRIVEEGFIGCCSYKSTTDNNGDYVYVPSDEFALADQQAVINFLDEHLGGIVPNWVPMGMNARIRSGR